MIRFLFSLMLALCTVGFSAAEKIGADAAAPAIAEELAALKTQRGTTRLLTEAETGSLIALAAKLSINVFELLDDTYRYASAEGVRFILSGASLRSAATSFDMGGERIDSLLPIEKTDRVELGATLKGDQEAMDVYLTAPHSDYIELGTAMMERRFGFKRLEPRLFAEAYGVKVKRFPISTELDRIELYAPAKGAIYVKALNRPKRWNLNVIRYPG
jgi:hypothetical protein